VGAHPGRRGLVPALPTAGRLRPVGPPPAHALGRRRLAGHRRRRCPRSRTPETRPPAAAPRSARHR
jgi:hypothetical protein